MKLRRFILVRFLLTIPMTLLLLTLVFVITHVVPGDPVTVLMGEKGSQEYIQELRHKLGLDKPLYVQYLDYIGNLLRGDLGYSLVRQRPVIDELLAYFPATLELTICAMAVGFPLGLYLGTTAAKNQGTKADIAIRIGALIRWCMPVFWIGILLQIVVVLYIPTLPIAGRISSGMTLHKITGLYLIDSILTGNIVTFVDSLKHLILPAFILGTMMASSLARISRANIIGVLGEEYIRIARLKGCSEKRVFQKHALPNALIPIFTYAGLQFSMLLVGAIMTETVFSWPGLGRLMISAVGYRDFNLIQGCVVFFALITGLVNLVVDVSYAIIDPRVRY